MSKAVSIILFLVFGVVCGVGGFYFGKVTAYSGLVKEGIGIIERDGRFKVKDSVLKSIKERRLEASGDDCKECPCICQDCTKCPECVCPCNCSDCVCQTPQTKI